MARIRGKKVKKKNDVHKETKEFKEGEWRKCHKRGKIKVKERLR